MTSEMIAAALMILGSGIAGYALRAIQHPAQKRDKAGRFKK